VSIVNCCCLLPAALLSPPRIRHHVIKQALKQPASEVMRRITKGDMVVAKPTYDR